MKVIPRSAWAPRHGRGNPTPGPQSRVTFHHAPERVLPPNPTRAQVAEQIRIMEDWHARTLTPTNPRIGYHFAVVDQTGEAWELLGWSRIGAHVAGHNTPSLGVLILGINGAYSAGRPSTWDAVADLVSEGIRDGHLTDAPTLEPHRQRVRTECPGDVLANFVEGMTLGTLLGYAASIPEPSGELAVEPPAVPAVDLTRIIIPERVHFEAAAKARGWNPLSMSADQWLVVTEAVLRVAQLSGRKELKAAADALARIIKGGT